MTSFSANMKMANHNSNLETDLSTTTHQRGSLFRLVQDVTVPT